jgi:hypothetical protein
MEKEIFSQTHQIKGEIEKVEKLTAKIKLTQQQIGTYLKRFHYFRIIYTRE